MNALKAINRIIEVKQTINSNEGVRITFTDLLELSLDCLLCSAKRRTVFIIASGEAGQGFQSSNALFPTDGETVVTAICTPSRHAYPARVLETQVSNENLPTVIYRVGYLFGDFIDRKRGEKATDRPTWARVHFMVQCPQCDTRTENSTQTNLVRPWTARCQCGYLLYTDDNPPAFQNLEVFEKAWF